MHIVSTCEHVYHFQIQLNTGEQSSGWINDGLWDELRNLWLLRKPGPGTRVLFDAAGRKRGHRTQCARLQKRGKWASIRTKLKANPSRSALPSILLSNVRSFNNKMDLLQLQRTGQREIRDCSVLILTETWLNDSILDAAIQLVVVTAHRTDSIAALSDKTGWSVCL